MGFVQIAFLGALGALAIPLIVHLMFRVRTRRVDLGTIRFLKEVLQKNARRKRVKRLSLLLLRMICVALLAFLFARPYFIAEGVRSHEQFVAILIDRSASMQAEGQGTNLVEEAVAQARKVIKASDKNTRVEVAFFDHKVRPLGGQLDGDVVSQLQASETAYCATDYGAALAWARDICVNSGAGEKELHVFTDFQRSGFDWSDMQSMPRDVKVRLHELGQGSPSNVAVTAADLSRTLIRPGETATVAATILNSSPFPREPLTVRLFLRSERRSYNKQQQINLAPGALETFEFEIEDLQPGFWQGQVEVEVEDADDDLRFDNKRYLAVMAAPRWNVLVVDGQPHASAVLGETYFLEAALRLAPPGESFPDTPYQPTIVPHDGVLPDLEGQDLVVLANVSSINPDDAKRLGEFVEQGGGVVVFCGDKVESDGYEALKTVGLSPGAIRGARQSNDLPWRIREWDERHSIFTAFNDPQHGDLRRLGFHGYTRIEPTEQAHVLATFRGGDPALLELNKGRGQVLWFTSACDRQWSDWARSRLYLPLVHQMLGHLTGLNEGGPVRHQVIDSLTDLAPDVKPGVYERDRFWQVVNVSPRESETDRCDAEEFIERFELNVTDSAEPALTKLASVGPTTAELRDDEIWHWVIFALVGMLCLECLLANRTTA